MKPFVKWVGGKTQFLEIINLLFPSQYNNFVEPFVGGGAVYLAVGGLTAFFIAKSNKKRKRL